MVQRKRHVPEAAGDGWVKIEVKYVTRATERAIEAHTGSGAILWIPRSVIRGGAEVERKFRGSLCVKEWFAKKEMLF